MSLINREFDFFSWGRIIYEIEQENNKQLARRVSEKTTRKMMKEAIEQALKTKNYDNFPDNISNSDISDDSTEMHLENEKRKKCCFCFFRK
jgi:pyruvoyl-dependent arginine decarboxylase (PvlArgDC)